MRPGVAKKIKDEKKKIIHTHTHTQTEGEACAQQNIIQLWEKDENGYCPCLGAQRLTGSR